MTTKNMVFYIFGSSLNGSVQKCQIAEIFAHCLANFESQYVICAKNRKIVKYILILVQMNKI